MNLACFSHAFAEASYVTIWVEDTQNIDAIASASALYSLCMQKKKKCAIVSPLPIASQLQKSIAWVEKTKQSVPKSSDLLVVLVDDDTDTAALEGFCAKCVCLCVAKSCSHKAFSCVVNDANAFGFYSLVFTIFEKLQAKINPKVATALYGALVAKTSRFCIENLDGTVFALAQSLLAAGANHRAVNRYLQKYSTLSQIRLLGTLLQKMRLRDDATTAYIQVDTEVFLQTGADISQAPSALYKTLELPTVLRSVLAVVEPDRINVVSMRRAYVDVAACNAKLSRFSLPLANIDDQRHIEETIIQKVKEIEKKEK